MTMVTVRSETMRVLPKADATCPCCQAEIEARPVIANDDVQIQLPGAFERADGGGQPIPRAGTKSISSTEVAVERDGSQSQINTKAAGSQGKVYPQPAEHVPSKLEARYTYAMHKTVDFVFILIVLVIVGDWIIERRLNFEVIFGFGLLGAAFCFYRSYDFRGTEKRINALCQLGLCEAPHYGACRLINVTHMKSLPYYLHRFTTWPGNPPVRGPGEAPAGNLLRCA